MKKQGCGSCVVLAVVAAADCRVARDFDLQPVAAADCRAARDFELFLLKSWPNRAVVRGQAAFPARPARVASLQDPAVQAQVKAMLEDPSFQDSMKQYMEQVTKDPQFEAIRAQTEQMMQQEDFVDQMQKAFSDLAGATPAPKGDGDGDDE